MRVRVLVADDDPLLCELVRFKLEATGYTVLVAHDGVAALAKAEQERPDLIVLDSMMPVLSGPEVLRALKENGAVAAIPVLMLTARKGQEDVVGALRAGASDYLTKPFLPDELVVRLEGLLARRSGANSRAKDA